MFSSSLCLIFIVSALLRFSLAYGKDAKGNGILGYPITYYFFHNTQDTAADLNGAPTIANSIFAVYELGFAIITAALVTISLAGKLTSKIQIFEFDSYSTFLFRPC